MTKASTIEARSAMADAQSYSEWSEAAKSHDTASGTDLWKSSDVSKYFDYSSIRQRLERLSELWKAQDNKGLLYALNEGIHGNMDGMGHERLYQKAKFGTKDLIQDYVDAIINSLNYLASDKVDDISFEEKLDFLRRAQHCYGRSAFLMSGSGTFLFFHLGVARELWQQGVLPRIISGSSGGAIVGSIMCSHTNEQLEELLRTETILQTMGSTEDGPKPWSLSPLPAEQIHLRLSNILPDLTFQECYELTGRHLNISVAPAEQHQTSRLLNAIASPNVYIREAVFASCAVPGVYPPVTLAAKDHRGKRVPYLPDRKWVDGSVTNDLPTKRLARLYGVNHHIVSQANPLVSPLATFVSERRGIARAVQRAAVSTTKAWINAAAAFWQRPLAMLPQLNATTSMALSVINQDYSGDINIIRPNLMWSPAKILGELPPKDVEFLIDLGQRTAWPKIEMIRTQTAISETLCSILQDYETDLAVHNHGKFPLKSSMA